MTPLRFSQNLFFSIRKISVPFKSSPAESTRFFCTILLFSKSVAWGESPGWRSRRFAVSTDRTSVSVFNLSRDLKRYKMTFCTKLSQIQSVIQLRWTHPIKKRRLNMPVGTFNRLPILPTPSARDTGSGTQRFPAVSALPSPQRCFGSHTDRQIPLFLSSLPACQQLPASSTCR